MYRLFKADNGEFLAKILKAYNRRPNVCELCVNNSFIQGQFIHSSSSKRVHYLSALKFLLSKKTKKSKTRKSIVEVVEGKGDNLVNTTASVDVMRGKQLTALTKQLTNSKQPQNRHASHKRLISADSTKNYDPLLVLPVDATALPTFQTILQHQKVNKNSSVNTISPYSDPLGGIGPSISVPDIIFQYKKHCKNSEPKDYVKINKKHSLTDLMRPKDFNGIRITGKNKRNLLDLRKKLSSKDTSNDCKKYVEVKNEEGEEEHLEIGSEVADKKLGTSKKSKLGYNVSIKKKTREAIAKQKLSDLEQKGKMETLNANFLSYSEVCVHTGLLNDAFYAVKSYRKMISMRTKQFQPKISDIQIYNTISLGFAERENWQRIVELLTMAREDGLKLDVNTYASMLDCLGRRNSKNVSLIRSTLTEMESEGISSSDVYNKALVSTESRKSIIKAIRAIHPDFEPEKPEINLDYTCPLLDKLNNELASNTSPVPSSLTVEDLKQFYDEQLTLEKNNYVKIKSIEKRDSSCENMEAYRKKLAETEQIWETTISECFDRDLAVLRAQGRHRSHFFFSILPYLLSIPKKDHVQIVMQEIRKLAEGSETYSPTTKQLYRELGTQVFLRYQIRKKEKLGALDEMDKLFKDYCEWYVNPTGEAANTREKWQLLLQENSALHRLTAGDILWKTHVLQGVGRFLYNIIIRDIKINVNTMRLDSQKEHSLPAFYTLFRTKGHTCKEEVKPHPVLSRLFRGAAPEHLVFEASKIPMVCPPLPWTTILSGGYLTTKSELIRLPYQAVAQWKILEKTPVNNLYPAFDSLNQLGAVPWVVNQEVLDVVLDVFNSGGSSKLDVPEPPSSCPPAAAITSEMSPEDRRSIFQQRMAVRRRKAEMYSLWCDALYKLSLAHHFRDRIFWLPHNMDFRGRVYPIAPHLNHLGSDLSRSLLVFAKGLPLGKDGFDWLKIHAINLTGTHKKVSVQERLEYANSIIDEMVDSAENPLTGRMWWAKSEEPWQTLAACKEVRKALASGDPASYVSQFPVHQDGSCNGLQHYAALGRDQAGGESVNLTPAPVPQDVYSCVATIVERERAKDAANGVLIAQQLEGFIYRKVIKQTVMTTVYGVTRFGARLQIARQLKDLDDFPKEHIWQASMYLVNKTFESLQEMFTSTKEIQDWFTECARLIAQVCGENVQWVTPLGLPIVQHYSRTSHSAPHDFIKFIGVNTTTLADAFERPNVMKQKNAFPPNFIHSLDSSHMMLTSIMCERLGVTFVSVHDCYWTHACAVPTMNRVCRDQFVSLHTHPILADLSQYLYDRFAYPESSFLNDGSVGDLAKRNLNRVLKDLPRTGTLDLQAVLQSQYFFS